MELSIIRWSIAGCTCNFRMNITHFISVVFGKTSLDLTIGCVGNKRPCRKDPTQLPFPLSGGSSTVCFPLFMESQHRKKFISQMSCFSHLTLNTLSLCCSVTRVMILVAFQPLCKNKYIKMKKEKLNINTTRRECRLPRKTNASLAGFI